jgi:hypothetical protein
MNFQTAKDAAKLGLISTVLMAFLSSGSSAQFGSVVSRREFERLTVIQRAAYFERTIRDASIAEGVDPRLIWAIAYNETRFRPWLTSKKNARGLMQFIPATASRFGLSDPYDPGRSIVAAVRYVKYLSSILDGRLDSILAAYNAGEGTVLAYLNGKPLYLGNKTINPGSKRTAGGVPPYPETIAYVRSGLRAYRWLEGKGELPFHAERSVYPVPVAAGSPWIPGVDSIRVANEPRRRPFPKGPAPAAEVYFDPRNGNRYLIQKVTGRLVRLETNEPIDTYPGTLPRIPTSARTTFVGSRRRD